MEILIVLVVVEAAAAAVVVVAVVVVVKRLIQCHWLLYITRTRSLCAVICCSIQIGGVHQRSTHRVRAFFEMFGFA